MSYSPQIVTTEGVRDFFNPRLSETEYSDEQLLAKIKAVEYAVNTIWGASLSDDDESIVQATIMLVAAKIGSEPKVIQRRVTLTREAWVTEKQASEGSDPYSIVRGWETEARLMLSKKLIETNKRNYKVY